MALDQAMTHNYCIIDTETTGLDPARCGLVEVAAIKIVNGIQTATYESFVDPGMSIPPRATAINGITTDMVVGARSPLEALGGMRSFVGDLMLIGHNIGFDLSFINKYTSSFVGLRCLDTKGLAKLVFGRRIEGGLSQENLEKYFGIKRDIRHRAVEDCKALHKVLKYLIGLSPDIELKKVSFNNTKSSKSKYKTGTTGKA